VCKCDSILPLQDNVVYVMLLDGSSEKDVFDNVVDDVVVKIDDEWLHEK